MSALITSSNTNATFCFLYSALAFSSASLYSAFASCNALSAFNKLLVASPTAAYLEFVTSSNFLKVWPSANRPVPSEIALVKASIAFVSFSESFCSAFTVASSSLTSFSKVETFSLASE